MANQIYGYNTNYGLPGAVTLSSAHSTKSISDPYNPESSLLASARYLSNFDRYSSDSSAAAAAYSASFSAMDRGSSFLHNQNSALKFPVAEGGGAGLNAAANILSMASRFPSSTLSSSHFGPPANVGSIIGGLKRPSEVLYHQQFLGSHNSFGQNEALFSDSLTKRLRSESTSNFIIYPQRPGERDCAHYMLTRTCKFGDSCRFDHPIWVPEGGIPDWKEVPFVGNSEVLPERPGEPSCPYYLKTQKCKFGQRCKFNHPQNASPLVVSADDCTANLPERPSEPVCSFYVRTGKCKFGESCKFNHPKDIQSSLIGTENYDASVNANGGLDVVEAPVVDESIFMPPASIHNSKGLPVRQGEVDCTFYMKTGSCKFGAMCRFNHPDRVVVNSSAAAISNSLLANAAANLNNHGVMNALGSVLQVSNPALAQTYLGLGSTILPQRPGEIECDYYMKTGQCKYGERCRFHHPMDRSSATTAMGLANQGVNDSLQTDPVVILTPAGLPRRPEAIMCAFYLRTGTCRFGPTCKFDHPPPAEVMEKAASDGHHPPDPSLL